MTEELEREVIALLKEITSYNNIFSAKAEKILSELKGIKAIIFNVGTDTLDEYELEKLYLKADDVVIYKYEQGAYDGNGIIVVKHGNGSVQYANLGHCSCYGPTDQVTWSDISLEALLDNKDDLDRRRTPNDYDYSMWNVICEKAREIWS